MRRFLILMAFVAFFAPLASAQNDESRFEFFGGYSLLRSNAGDDGSTSFDDDDSTTLNGFNVAATGYFTERFGITGDFSGHFDSEELVFPAVVGAPTSGKVRLQAYNYAAGPHVRFSNASRVTPFVRALAGAQTQRAEFDVQGGSGSTFGGLSGSESTTDFALVLGGGLDVKVSDRFAVRAFQVDYNPVFRGDTNINIGGVNQTFEGSRQDNVRFSIGVVFK